MYKILIPLLATPLGLIAGAIYGGLWFAESFGTGSHMDMSGLLGILVGAPLGAAVGAGIGWGVGRVLDRVAKTGLTPAARKRIGIPCVIGGLLGVLAAIFTREPSLPIIVCAWLGLCIGSIWHLLAEWHQKNSR